ncbi:MAG: flagellar hook-length control protein FliK, partial [Ignavibacteria bacterium]|nr:flagellar hook-length control protein FliK [Ignavibacteria bacterium]
ESPNTATDGSEAIQGFLPILMQLLPNTPEVPAAQEEELAGIAVSAISGQKEEVTGIPFPEISGKENNGEGVIRFSAATAASPPMQQDAGQVQKSITKVVQLPDAENVIMPSQLSFFGSADEPTPVKSDEPVPVGKPVGASDKSAAENSQGDKQMTKILEGMSVVHERTSGTARPILSPRESTNTESSRNDAPAAPPQEAGQKADVPIPRDFGSSVKHTGSEKSETQNEPPPPHAPEKQVADGGEKARETGLVQRETRAVRQDVPGQDLKIPDGVSTHTSEEFGRPQVRPRGGSSPAAQESPEKTVAAPPQESGMDDPAGSSSLNRNAQDPKPASHTADATKGETVPAASPHTAAHTIQTGSTGGTTKGSAVAQQIPVLPPDVARSVIDQVARELAQRIGDQGSEIKLRLKPETLGELALKVKLENGAMTAQIDVTQAGVKAALESNLADLRVALQSRGIEVKSIDIFSQSEMSSNAGGQMQSRSHSNGKRRFAFDSTARYQSSRQMGYNTIEIII